MTKPGETKKAKKRGLAKGLSSLLSGDFLTRSLVQANLPFIFFMVVMMISYIGYGY
ncbi:MAG: hypothetical protein ACI9O2_000161, partial [Flammeovirgaceae bacterium]